MQKDGVVLSFDGMAGWIQTQLSAANSRYEVQQNLIFSVNDVMYAKGDTDPIAIGDQVSFETMPNSVGGSFAGKIRITRRAVPAGNLAPLFTPPPAVPPTDFGYGGGL